MHAHQEIASAVQVQAIQHVGSFDLRSVVVQHLTHVRTSLDDGLGRHTFGDQVAPGMFGEHHVDVAEVVQHLAVELFGYALVEAPVAGLHMEDRDLAALGREHRQA
ncbi:hypothetical protein D9M68_915450 [compost metagenome]